MKPIGAIYLDAIGAQLCHGAGRCQSYWPAHTGGPGDPRRGRKVGRKPKKKKAGGRGYFQVQSLKDIDDRPGPCMAFIKALDMKPLALILTSCTSVKK